MNPPSHSPNRWERNRAHWDDTIDARNLSEQAETDLRRDLALYNTADVRTAIDWLTPEADRTVLDLGGGLALGAILLAQAGADVVICDISPRRLKAAKTLLEEAGLEERVLLVAGTAENLPFATESLDGVFTKSVLIHTRLEEAARECGRVLETGGRFAFIEPMRRNPFVNAYRRLFAPKIWQDITTYFGPDEWRLLRHNIHDGAGSGRDFTGIYRVYFFVGFFASLFSFALKNPMLYHIAEKALCALDRLLFRVWRPMRRYAWFGLLRGEITRGIRS